MNTPAPWMIDGDRGVIYGEAAADSGELPICQLLHDHTQDQDADRGAADAALIIAAPRLLQALQVVATTKVDASTKNHRQLLAALMLMARVELDRLAKGAQS